MAVDRKAASDHRALLGEAQVLEKNMWRNWILLVVVILVTMTAFITDLLPGVSSKMSGWWAWEGTDVVLRGGMIASLLALIGYLTHQQRKAVDVRKRLHESLAHSDSQLRRNHDRLGGMLEVTRALAAEVDPQAIFDRIAGACRETFACDQVSLMLLNRESGLLEVRAADGHANIEEVKGKKTQVGEGIAGWVAQNRKPILLGKSLQIRARFGVEYDSTPLTAAMIVPIIVRDELVGVINVSSRNTEHVYLDEDLQALLVFAEQAGVALRHTEQTTWLRQTLARLDEGAAASARDGNGAARVESRGIIGDVAA